MNLRYQICACLYQGTACEVFLVRDIVTSQLYALKRIVRHHAEFSDAYLRAVYQREACMLGWLQHERIPHLISAFEEEQYRCILMEYIPGVSLSRIQGCKSGCSGACSWESFSGISMSSRLYIWISSRPICSTGREMSIYWILRPAVFCRNRMSQPRCLPGYSPKEAGTLNCDERSDIYSFGRTCYVLRHGQFPADGTCRDALDALLLHCCQEEKNQRFSSMQAVMKELVRLCEG